MTDNPVRPWEDVKAMLEKEIQVWYCKDEELNQKRERMKVRAIDWIIAEMKKGVDLEHTMKRYPDYVTEFGEPWPYIQKAMKMRYPNCAICGKPTQEIHHIRPRFLKGENVPSNLIPLCLLCHDEVHRRIDDGIARVIKESIGPDAVSRMRKISTLNDYME